MYCHAHAAWGQAARAHGLLHLVTAFIGTGGKGVDLFVVLSGFCLFYPVAKRFRNMLPQHTTLEFYRRRLSRICPVYFSAIVFALAVIGVGFRIADNRGLADLWPHALFMQNMMPGYIGRVDGPLWSVALEMQLYLLFPLFAWLVLNGFGNWLVVVCAALSMAASVGSDSNWFAGDLMDPTLSYALPARAVQFVLGMVAASICALELRNARLLLYSSAPLAVSVAALSAAKSQHHLFIRHLSMIAWGLVGACLVIALIDAHRRYGRIPRFLIPLQRIGLISFSLYVVHFPIMIAMGPYVVRDIHGPLEAVGLFTFTGLPVTLILAWLMFLFVERYTLNNVKGHRSLDVAAVQRISKDKTLLVALA